MKLSVILLAYEYLNLTIYLEPLFVYSIRYSVCVCICAISMFEFKLTDL